MLHRFLRFVLLTLVLLFLLGGMFGLTPSVAVHADSPNGPDFSGVKDILQGRRTLFPSDDLIMTVNDVNTGQGNPNTVTTLLRTVNDAVTVEFPHPIAANPNQAFFVTAAGRMFNLPRDVVVTLLPGQTVLIDQNVGYVHSFPNSETAFQPGVGDAVTDLTGDGFADVAFVNHPTGDTTTLNVMTATNVNDTSEGFFYGTPIAVPGTAALVYTVAAGDFDGDGVNEIAVGYTDADAGQIVVALYRPHAIVNAQGNVTALTLQQVGSVNIPYCCSFGMALTAGRYNGLPNPALVLSYDVNTQTAVQPIAVTATANPNQDTLTLEHLTTFAYDSEGGINAQSAYLDFFDTNEQVVLYLQGGNDKPAAGNILVLSYDNNYNVALSSDLAVPSVDGVQLAMALGNFDQPDTMTNPVIMEVALVYENQTPVCGANYGLLVQMYHISLSDLKLTPAAANQTESCYDDIGFSVGLTTGDTQGRSLVLGSPSKLTAQHIQPHLILDAPPSHVDYVNPVNSNTPAIVNLSADPDGFYSSYQTQVTSKAQSSSQGTTSYTNAAEVSGSFGVKFGDPLVGSVSASVGASAGFMDKKFVKKTYGQYASTSFDASTKTGFDDQVWFNAETHNIYIYPVIGKTACPSDVRKCTHADKVPLTIMVSGPTIRSQQSVSGANLEWYQPIHEIGNLFSYPWNLQQLQNIEGNINLLTSRNPTSFSTDSSSYTATANWRGQSNSSVTSGSTSNVSWGTTASMTEKASIFGGITGNQKFSYNGSKAVSTINTYTTSLGQSTGIGIVKPGTFPRPDEYQYPIFPYIFGNNPVSGTVQSINLGTQIQTNGILRASYTVDPSSNSAGTWWNGLGQYTLPDIAFAHPARWQILNQPAPANPPPPNCVQVVATSQRYDCAYFNAPQTDIWTSQFYWMKGLLITPANANGEGPQLGQATAGDQIQIAARVYNDSLADMPQASQVVVQFYGQPWNAATLKPQGNAFLINTVQAGALPGFNSQSNGGTLPNWELVETTFDTTNYSNQNLVFWCVVYMTKGQALVAEMPGHGLSAIPPTLTSVSDATPYLERYSNNIGFYKRLFYIAPQNAPTAVDPAQAGLKITQVLSSATNVHLGDKVTVSGLVSADSPTDGVSILFSDLNPDNTEALFDVEQIAHVGGSARKVSTIYEPKTCGQHTLTLSGLEASFAAMTQLNVSLNPISYIRRMKRVLGTVNLKSNNLAQLLAHARKAFKHKDTNAGLLALHQFQTAVEAKRGKQIPTTQADQMLEALKDIFGCIK